MKQVLANIETLTREFSALPYFRILETPGRRSELEIMARGLTFFVLSFQDVLRLNAEKMTEPLLKEIAAGQRKDDAGHDTWFLNDLAKLGIEPNLKWVFGKDHQRTRDASYEIISEVYAASDDYSRLIVALVLEATSGVYFSRVYKFVASMGLEDGLVFFSRHHWDVEQSHELFEDAAQNRLKSIELCETSRAHAVATASRVFRSVSSMCNDLSARMLKARDDQEVMTSSEGGGSVPQTSKGA